MKNNKKYCKTNIKTKQKNSIKGIKVEKSMRTAICLKVVKKYNYLKLSSAKSGTK